MHMSSKTCDVKSLLDGALLSLPPNLRREALTHVSHANEKGPSSRSNERLEFLGDAVLYLSVGDILFERYPIAPEGDLTRMRAWVVSGQNLASVAEQAGLPPKLLVGKGEDGSGGRNRPRILAGALEAIIGAVYLTKGWEEARRLTASLLMKGLSGGPDGADVPLDPKTAVQERVQRTPGATMEYKVINVEGPDHSPTYTVALLISGITMSKGRGQSKKEAEEDAAASYLRTKTNRMD